MLDDVADGAVLEVPALWSLEVANALRVLVRRGRLDDEERQIGLGAEAGVGLQRRSLAQVGKARRRSIVEQLIRKQLHIYTCEC